MTPKVWAPEAERVEIEAAGTRTALERGALGWWSHPSLRIPPDTDYAFRVDGGEPLPDPRAPRLPRGVHGPARTVDHAAFEWRDAGFHPKPWDEAVVYELHVGTFTPEGTFDGVAQRLDHLVGLGVTHVELLPVNAFSGRHGWGYDGVGLYAPHEPYGGPEGLKRLVDACHRRGLAVVLDVVYNHLGPEGNYLERFSSSYFTGRYHTPWGKAVNLDGPWSDEVRRFFCDNALGWLRDYHVDALRIDAIHAFLDTSATPFLEQLAIEVGSLEEELERSKVLIAESDLNDPRVVHPRAAGGHGIDAQWSDDLHHALHAALTGERVGYYADFGSLGDVAAALERAFVYDGRYSHHRRRTHGRSTRGLGGDRFLGYLQNHDQVGNRARGERIAQLAGEDGQLIGAALYLTAPFVPMIFQGEEWAASSPFRYFTDHTDRGLARAVREGRRGEFAAFGWKPEDVPDPQAQDTFERSRLDWDERERDPHRRVLAQYRALLALRREQPELRDGRMEAVAVGWNDEARWISVSRGPITILCNLSERPREIPLAPDRPRDVLFASRDGTTVAAGAVTVPPRSAAVLGPSSPRPRTSPPETDA